MAALTEPPSQRASVKRLVKRADYDQAAVHAILDEGLVAHVGIVDDIGQPYVIPMVYGRDGDRLLLHGSVASRLQRHLAGGAPVSVTVTLLDGLVLARATFHHSVNYRSVVVLGTANRISEVSEAASALDRIVEHLVPGRTAEARPPNPTELAQTTVLEVPLAEASAKVRTGGPVDESEDLGLDVWAGVLPLSLQVGAPLSADDLGSGIPVAPSALAWRR